MYVAEFSFYITQETSRYGILEPNKNIKFKIKLRSNAYCILKQFNAEVKFFWD
jgi:hypothetical protein